VWESARFTGIFLALSFSYISNIVHAHPHAGNANRWAAKDTHQVKNMRKRFSSQTLKQYFSTAWFCLPEKTRNDLSQFIRQVREVDDLEGTYIGCPDGTRFGPLESGEGFTFLYKDDETIFCDIVLSSFLLKLSQANAISIILHELSHASDYFISPEDTVNSPRFKAESEAWDKAITWAKEGITDFALSQEIELSALRAKLSLQLDELTEQTKSIIKNEV
jgi:hypothetical protein